MIEEQAAVSVLPSRCESTNLNPGMHPECPLTTTNHGENIASRSSANLAARVAASCEGACCNLDSFSRHFFPLKPQKRLLIVRSHSFDMRKSQSRRTYMLLVVRIVCTKPFNENAEPKRRALACCS